jgi:hypothetical protein
MSRSDFRPHGGGKKMPPARILTDKRRAWDVRELDLAVEALPHDGEELATSDEGRT